MKTLRGQILTPRGPLHHSKVHRVQPEELVRVREGTVHRVGAGVPKGPLRHLGEPEPASASQGWIEHAEITSRRPITSFRASWAVPAPPARQQGVLLGLGIGLQQRGRAATEELLYVVLQWGRYLGRGGASWGLACWYTPGGGQPLIQSTPVEKIPSGHTIHASVARLGPRRWVCQAGTAGRAATVLNLDHEPQFRWGCALLECHRFPARAIAPVDLPSSRETVFHGIAVKQGGALRKPEWIGEVDQAGRGRRVAISPAGIQLHY